MERNLEFGTVDLHFIREYVPLGKPLFEMCWFYMGNRHCPNSFRPSTPFVKRANVEKSAQIIWQAYTLPGNVGKKEPQTILASLYTPTPHL